MNLDFSAAENAFRAEVRDFVRERLPPAIRDKVANGLHLTRDEHLHWQRLLFERGGWNCPGWPKEYGGPGWSPVEQYIFEEETMLGGAPRLVPFGSKMVAPVIMRFGSDGQKRRFLPRILSAEEWWCQGYSEPGAGSDLASLRTRAVRVHKSGGDKYIVNGQKTWTTLGQHADWIFCLVRTDPEAKAQRGISFLLIDMKSPGITLRPIVTLDGAHEVNEIWFEDVEVPAENLVGEENQGWTCAKFLLGFERSNIAGIGIAKRELARLKQIAAAETKRGKPLNEDPLFSARLAEIEIDLMALEITNLRVLSAEAEHKTPGPEASILKIKGTELQQAISELILQAVGPYALPFGGASPGPDYAANRAAQYLNLRKLSIYGGSNEIQKNIVAQMILEL
ncbi:MAG: acyl-CoA dehydrogenase family protein [Rhodocyclaceae bacterium]|jgi:alkylation response protein AidB-like acyl-CoA dehydrogenase